MIFQAYDFTTIFIPLFVTLGVLANTDRSLGFFSTQQLDVLIVNIDILIDSLKYTYLLSLILRILYCSIFM